MEKRTFICYHCGVENEIDPSWTEEKKEAEFTYYFPNIDPQKETVGELCDDCQEEFISWCKKNNLLPPYS